jgi:type II secretory ATPase GspE/PulE/Tfp pilus assembly ATPase PilB-like protein
MTATLPIKPLGQRLLDRGLLQSAQLDAALLEQRKSGHERLLGEILIERQICSDEQIAEIMALAHGVPFARVGPRLADPLAVALLPKDFLERNVALPLFLVEGTLTVALADPANLYLAEEIERLTGHHVQLVASSARDIRATLDAYLAGEKMFVVEEVLEKSGGGEFSLPPPSRMPPIGDPALDGPVVKLVNACMFNAFREGASAVHIEPGEDDLRVRYRIDGRLVERLRPPPRMRDALTARLKLLAGLDTAQRRLPQDGSIRMTAAGRPVTLRLTTVPSRYGETIVIHLSEEERGPLRLEKLGFGYETLKQWKKLIARPSGLILVCGPSGSGKRETLYAALAERASSDLSLCSVEEPIERTLPGVNQFPVDERGGFTFASAVRSLLRQEPDVLMISWLRESETAKLAAQAALTGRLVLAGLHAVDTPSALARLLHLGVEPYVAGATVAGVLAQRSVRRLCSSCKEPHEPTAAQKRQIEPFIGPVDKLFRPRGCDKCHNLGYAGRVGIHELLVLDDTLSERLSQAAPLSELRDLATKSGLKSLRHDGLEKVKSGLTTLDEVYRVTG